MTGGEESCPVKKPATEEESLDRMPRDRADRVVVTGASGFVGKGLCRALHDRGEKLRVLLRPGSDDTFFKSLGAEIYSGDITDPEVPDWLLDGASLVINLAAVVSRKGIDEQEFTDVHVMAVERLCQAAIKRRVKRLVSCSTIGVLGHIEHPPADEESDYNAVDIYQTSKAEGERVALSYNGQEGLEVTVVRPAVIYGPGDMRMLKLFRYIANGTFKMIGSGETLTHPVYIDDLVAGIIAAGETPQAAGQIYILGGEGYVTLNQWVQVIAEAASAPLSPIRIPYRPLWLVSYLCELVCAPLGIEPPLFRRRVDFFVKDRAFSIEKAKRELGYAPAVGLEEGARRTLDWYKAEGLI